MRIIGRGWKVKREDVDAYVRQLVEGLSWRQGRERQECPACGFHYMRRVHRRMPWHYLFARYGAYRYQCSNCAQILPTRNMKRDDLDLYVKKV